VYPLRSLERPHDRRFAFEQILKHRSRYSVACISANMQARAILSPPTQECRARPCPPRQVTGSHFRWDRTAERVRLVARVLIHYRQSDTWQPILCGECKMRRSQIVYTLIKSESPSVRVRLYTPEITEGAAAGSALLHFSSEARACPIVANRRLARARPGPNGPSQLYGSASFTLPSSSSCPITPLPA
jgi:hypothetical protein